MILPVSVALTFANDLAAKPLRLSAPGTLVKDDWGRRLPHDQFRCALKTTFSSFFNITFSFPHLSAQPKQFTKTLVKLLACYWLLHRPRSDSIRFQRPRLTETTTTVNIVSNSTRIIRIFMSCFTTTTAVLTTPLSYQIRHLRQRPAS